MDKVFVISIKINGNRQTVKITANARTLRTPDITKLWQRHKLHTKTFSREKDPRKVFVYLRLTPRQIEISICNLARGSDRPGILPAADRATNRDWLVPDLPIRPRVAERFLCWPIFLSSGPRIFCSVREERRVLQRQRLSWLTSVRVDGFL